MALRNVFFNFLKKGKNNIEYTQNVNKEYSSYFDDDCPYSITPKKAEEIISRRLYKDYIRACKERYTGFWITDASIDVVDIDDRKCYIYQVKEADIAWKNRGESYDGVVSPEGLRYLRCLVDVNTGEYKYYPDK